MKIRSQLTWWRKQVGRLDKGWPLSRSTKIPFSFCNPEPEKTDEEEPPAAEAAAEDKVETENGKPEDAEQEEEDDQEYEVVDDAEAVKGGH